MGRESRCSRRETRRDQDRPDRREDGREHVIEAQVDDLQAIEEEQRAERDGRQARDDERAIGIAAPHAQADTWRSISRWPTPTSALTCSTGLPGTGRGCWSTLMSACECQRSGT